MPLQLVRGTRARHEDVYRRDAVRADQAPHGFEQGQRTQAMAIYGKGLVEKRQQLGYKLLQQALDFADRRLVDARLAPRRLDRDEFDIGIELIGPGPEGRGAAAGKRESEEPEPGALGWADE